MVTYFIASLCICFDKLLFNLQWTVYLCIFMTQANNE
jgi:hypothetical protein